MNQEEDLDVRWADQEQINEFGRLNNRLLEIRAESKQAGIDAEKLDDATAELMMATSSGDAKVMLLIGESFIESTEDEANDCESMSLGGSFAWRKGPRHSRCQKSTDLLPYRPWFLYFVENTDCERKQKALHDRIAALKTEEDDIVAKQEALKKTLYARFGDSINLES